MSKFVDDRIIEICRLVTGQLQTELKQFYKYGSLIQDIRNAKIQDKHKQGNSNGKDKA